jgi:hypothetical protein
VFSAAGDTNSEQQGAYIVGSLAEGSIIRPSLSVVPRRGERDSWYLAVNSTGTLAVASDRRRFNYGNRTTSVYLPYVKIANAITGADAHALLQQDISHYQEGAATSLENAPLKVTQADKRSRDPCGLRVKE